jgi:hypothetical protein
VGDNNLFVLLQKLVGENGILRRGIVMVKLPGLFSPKFVAICPQFFTHWPQNVAV